jgi:hypothetical protein
MTKVGINNIGAILMEGFNENKIKINGIINQNINKTHLTSNFINGLNSRPILIEII